MGNQPHINYLRIEKAIEYIIENYKAQPSLQDISQSVELSPAHFQRLFQSWAGVSPKQFVRYLSSSFAKSKLAEQNSLLDTALSTGLSGSSRLHDMFITIEGMTPGEYKSGGESLKINYEYSGSPFGKIIVASTGKGICHIAFNEDEKAALAELTAMFPKAKFSQQRDHLQDSAMAIFKKDWNQLDQIKLHLYGTPFQIKIWESLLKIPESALVTYKDVATVIGSSSSSRAVGTAIGKNPIAYLIPCHRVIQTSGQLGGYRWGLSRKSAIIGWEAAKKEGLDGS
tara:strand:+ start:223123 stop:223974 length:852 start_codon:yes stop_codon:yes gene_type:complete